MPFDETHVFKWLSRWLLVFALVSAPMFSVMPNESALAQSVASITVSGQQERTTSAAEAPYRPHELLVKFRPSVRIPEVTAANLGGTLITGYQEIDQISADYGIISAARVFSSESRTAEATESQQGAAAASTRGSSGSMESANGLERIYKLQLREDSNLLAAMGALGAASLIEYAEPNYRYTLAVQPKPSDNSTSATAAASGPSFSPALSMVPEPPDTESATNDPLLYYEWGLHNIGQSGGKDDIDIDAVEAWEIVTGTTDILIAVIDSGADFEHEDLNDGRLRKDMDKNFVGYSYETEDEEETVQAQDNAGHGTHVTGIIGARTDNGAGISGVMWNVEILPLKVCYADGSCNADSIARAIHYATDAGARIINLSLGGSCSETMVEAINYAHGNNVVLVAAAGNEAGSVSYPAKHSPIIAVGAVDPNGERAFFSNYGESIDVVAPGVNIFSTVPGSSYDSLSGTSMAAPYVAGVAGLLLSQRPELTNEQVRLILQQSAKDLGAEGADNSTGYGLVSAGNAVRMESPDVTEIPAPAIANCSGCSADTATLDMPSRMDTLQMLWRTQLLMNSSGGLGEGYVQKFFRHSPEVSSMLLRNEELRYQAHDLLFELRPAIQSVLSNPGASEAASEADGGADDQQDVLITAEMVERLTGFKESVLAQAGDELAEELEATWRIMSPERFSGMKATEAWDVMHQPVNASRTVLLPLVVHE